ncbi:hypothetical protein Lbir_2935 [Legionella birminghamensis]|uniref:Transmembrane protein (Fibronectin III domain and Gp5 C-terminal repeat) n=1 Tax=Legionella birminghamensis TaxID=28083 RepID=A0A378IFF1_9GAMM|nr:hypothetical protein [Legionella birminghamensis]KTC68333.1 hypothetical protein Lbir_2935 [Legionella birminghamensis]STX30954.1 transmembrane protein (fibronectin III domain and Gp5 C-terminal repeat) [Legionella birminghamensis]
MGTTQDKLMRLALWSLGAAGLMLNGSLHASTPLWTYSAPSPAVVTVAGAETATVSYTVTNLSARGKNLVLQPIPGITASACHLAGRLSSCQLTLTIQGSAIPPQGIHTGPVLCQQGNPNQCYQPALDKQLNVNRASGLGHLLLSQFGAPVSFLSLRPGDSGVLLLTNTGGRLVSALDIKFPFGWGSYFTNNCPTLLQPQQSCTLSYAIPTPSAVGVLNPLTIMAAGADNNINIPVSIQAIGAAKCWGLNRYGQLGSTTNSGNFNTNDSPLDVQTLSSGIVSLTEGTYHSCALLGTGAIKCWGVNISGQLGSTTNSGTFNPNNSPLDVQTLSSGVAAFAAGLNHTCALLATGSVKCWGDNSHGQLGSTINSGSSNPNNSPLDVQTLNSGVVAIIAGYYHTCALLNTGAVKCWGDNFYGQLGSTTNSGTANPNNSPLDVQTLSSGVVAITAGGYHTCALLNTGAVKCWGRNIYGQLGSTTNSGNNTPNNSPLNVQTLNSRVVALTAGLDHTCALLDTGAVKCWGLNFYGQLGSTTNSGNNNPNNSPLDVQTLSSGVVAITAGTYHSCALLDTGGLKCWGLNLYGQLGSTTNSGNGNPNNSPLDVQALIATGIFHNGSGEGHSCAIAAAP